MPEILTDSTFSSLALSTHSLQKCYNYIYILVVLFYIAENISSANCLSVAAVTYNGKVSDGFSYIKNGRIALRYRRDTNTSIPVTGATSVPSTTIAPTNVSLNSNDSSEIYPNSSMLVPNLTSTEAPISTTTDTLSTTKSSLSTIVPTTTSIEDQENVTVKHDDRKYYIVNYTSITASGADYWRNIDGSSHSHYALDGHNQALQIQIPWKFTYYGHDVDHITVGIGGFLYMSEFLHNHLTATQYIAPLMANFDSSIGSGLVTYALFDDVFVVQWKELTLKDQPGAGTFTFQAQLFKEDGKIVFVYKKIPIPVSQISNKAHTVTIGIADAYYVDIGPFRTIYEYHNVSVDFEHAQVDSAIIFTHKKTCNLITDCNSCHAASIPQFTCFWCENVKRCSDVRDRGLQEWFLNRCPITTTDKETCPATTPTPPASTTDSSGDGVMGPCKDGGDCSAQRQSGENNSGLIAGIVIGVVLAVLLAGAVILYVYSYRNPTSVTGQLLIKYRPSQIGRNWNTRDTADRYTVGSQVLSNKAYEGDMY